MPDADARAAVEGEVAPAGAQALVGVPALGAEFEGVRAVDVGASVHGVDAVGDGAAFGDEDWREAIGAAAAGDGGVFVGEAGVAGDDGVEAEGLGLLVSETLWSFNRGEWLTFVEEILQVLETFESLVVRLLASQLVDLVLELLIDIWTSDEHVEGVT